MYWKFVEHLTIGSYILLQTSSGSFTLDINILQIIVGILVGLVPGFITAFIQRRKWMEGEKNVVESQASLNQTQAIENIAQAATMITTQAQTLNEKSAALIEVLESEVARQKLVIEQEREFHETKETQYRKDVEELKIEIAVIREQINHCAQQLKRIIQDLRDGTPISEDCLSRLEETISNVYE